MISRTGSTEPRGLKSVDFRRYVQALNFLSGVERGHIVDLTRIHQRGHILHAVHVYFNRVQDAWVRGTVRKLSRIGIRCAGADLLGRAAAEKYTREQNKRV